MITTNETENQLNFDFETQVSSYIENEFPQYHDDKILATKKEKFDMLNATFHDLNDIDKNKEKYSLHWAFRNASQVFNFKNLKQNSKTYQCSSFKNYEEVSELAIKHAKSRLNRFSRIFSILSYVVSILDIIVSIFLILVVTMLSHVGEDIFDTIMLSTLFIAGVAMVKVTLDRFFIIPVIDRWGWRLYNRMILYTEQELIKLNAMYVALMKSVDLDEDIDTRMELIKTQRRRILGRPRWSIINQKSPTPVST